MKTILFCLCLLLAPAEAVRVPITMETVREGGQPVILAEIVASSHIDTPAENGARRAREGYALKLDVHDVLRGKLDAAQIEIPFSGKGYNAVWEWEEKPAVGMKALVYLASGSGASWNDYGRPGSIVPLAEFDDARVATVRRIVSLWEMSGADRDRALRKGCVDADAAYAEYCVIDLIGRSVDVEFMWTLFHDERAPIAVLIKCDVFLSRRFASHGWRSHPARHDVLAAAAERHLEGIRNDGQLNMLVYEMCRFPADRQQVLQLLETVLGRESEANFSMGAAMRLGCLYAQLPGDGRDQRLNRDVVAAIRRVLAGEDPEAARGAAYALDTIARSAGNRGMISSEILELVSTEAERATTEKLRTMLQEIGRKAVEESADTKQLLTDDPPAVVLTEKWTEKVGKQVVIAGITSPHCHEKFGCPVEVGGKLVWIEGADGWPAVHSNRKGILLRGRLMQVRDIPVFRPEPGQPFAEGLPVPQPYDLEDAGTRLVLRDAKWELLGGR